jgi:hypothetical protein
MNRVCLSEKTNIMLKDYLRSRGYEIIEVRKTEAVYDAVSCHTDIYLCKIGDGLIVSQEQYPLIKDDLLRCRVTYSVGVSPLGRRYPADIKYNAAQLGGYLIHLTNQTDPVILDKAKETGLKPIHVKQGYTKCNLVIVDENAVISSDEGMSAVLNRYGIEVLLITQGHVKLSGFPYGFLGGASGRVGSELLFNGNLSVHPDFEKIKEFIGKRGLKTVWFEDYPLEDVGSLIQI